MQAHIYYLYLFFNAMFVCLIIDQKPQDMSVWLNEVNYHSFYPLSHDKFY